jgi:hypothetical protein
MRLRIAFIDGKNNVMSSIFFFAVLASSALMIAGGGIPLNFNSSSNSNRAFADIPPWARNPHSAGMGIVGMSSLQAASPNCDLELPAPDPNKEGESVLFKVPPGVADIVSAGETNKPANYHIAFEGDDNLYYEVGIYYGDWSRDSGAGYNATKFQIAWGIGGILKGVSDIPVVAGHTLELSIVHNNQNGTKQWQVWMHDLDDGSKPAQIVNIGRPSMKVKTDYFMFVEAGTFAPNTNTERLGMVEVLNIQQAISAPDDGKVHLSTWASGYLLANCSPVNNSYGITYLGSAGNFKIGYGGATTKNGYQFW